MYDPGFLKNDCVCCVLLLLLLCVCLCCVLCVLCVLCFFFHRNNFFSAISIFIEFFPKKDFFQKI